MLRKVRDADNARKEAERRKPSDIVEIDDFVFMGEEGSFTVRSLGSGRVNLEVHYPINEFSWLDRDSVRRKLDRFLRDWLKNEYLIINDKTNLDSQITIKDNKIIVNYFNLKNNETDEQETIPLNDLYTYVLRSIQAKTQSPCSTCKDKKEE